MIAWAKHKVITSTTTKQLKSEQAELPKAARQDTTPTIALQPLTKVPEAIVSAELLLEALKVRHLMIAQSEMPLGQQAKAENP